MFYYLYNIIYNTFFENVNQILPGLFLGNYKSALDINFIKDNNIDIIVNCTPDIPFMCENKDIEYIRIPVYDSLLEKDFLLMEHYFKIYLPYLYESYINNKKILVHCYAGKQRSAIVVAALLKKLMDTNCIDANCVLKENRNCSENDINVSSITNENKSESEKEIENKRGIEQFYEIISYIIKKRPQVFTYGFRINFKKTYKRFFKLVNT